MNSFGIDRVLQLLPHRYPFLLVDKVVEIERGKRLVAIKNVTVNEPFFQGHFPDLPVMPGVLQIEAIAQAAGLLAMVENEDDKNQYDTFLMSVEKAKFRKIVVPGDQLRIEITTISNKRHIGKVSGVITVDGQVAAEATMMFMLAPKSERKK